MNAWLALMKKEFQLTLPAFIIVLLLLGGILTGGYFIGNHFGFTDEVMLGASSFTLGVHTFLLTFYLFISVNTERKRLHLWLHNPMSITGLLSAKIFTGVIFTIVSFIVSMFFTVHFFRKITDIFNEQTIFNAVGTISAIVVMSAIFIAAVFLLFWSIFLTFSQKMNDFLSFILTLILFIITSWAYSYFMDLSFIDSLTKWGEIQMKDIIVGFEFNYNFTDQSAHGETLSETFILYIGDFVKEAIVAVIMFFAACWIIEKKVEV